MCAYGITGMSLSPDGPTLVGACTCPWRVLRRSPRPPTKAGKAVSGVRLRPDALWACWYRFQACQALLGGGTLSGVIRERVRLGLRPPQAKTKRATKGKSRYSVRTILLNPRIAGLSAYRGEIVGVGEWEPLVSEETWRAVRAILEDPARKPPRGVRTLLGGLARCPCGNVVTGMPSHIGHHIYRCAPATRNHAYAGGHVARQAAPVEDFIERIVIARTVRADPADLVGRPEREVDVAGLREKAAAVHANLEEMAADQALGLLTRAQMLAATERGNARLEEIADELADAPRESVLAPLLAASNAVEVGVTGPGPQARGHQDADDDHLALTRPRCPPRLRPRHRPGSPGVRTIRAKERNCRWTERAYGPFPTRVPAPANRHSPTPACLLTAAGCGTSFIAGTERNSSVGVRSWVRMGPPSI